jgi:hypothetical protein
LEKLTRISLAGETAQRRFNAKSWRPHHSAKDPQKAADLMSHVCQSEKELTARLHLHQIEVEQSLSLYWYLVDAVVQALLEKKTMIGWEVETIIGAAHQPIDNPPATKIELLRRRHNSNLEGENYEQPDTNPHRGRNYARSARVSATSCEFRHAGLYSREAIGNLE